MQNLFEKGCLVQLSTSVWGAARKIRPEQIIDKVASREWLSASKKLVDPRTLKPISKIVNRAQSYLSSVSLPFPVQGMVFMPKEMIGSVDEKLHRFKDDFKSSVESFMESYDQLQEVAMVCLGDLFNDMDYPVDIRVKFSFAWRFVILDVPNSNTESWCLRFISGKRKNSSNQWMKPANWLYCRFGRNLQPWWKESQSVLPTGLTANPKYSKMQL